MSMSTSEAEQLELVALAHEFAEKEIRPVAAQHDESEEYPWDVFYKAAEVGLTSFDLPEEFGGGGIHSLTTGCKIYEELAWGSSAIAQLIEGGTFFSGPILAMGTQEQKERWIPQLCTEKPTLGALAITEPGAGSDAAGLATVAKKVDGGYVLNGSKTWISNAPPADLYVVFATVAPGTRSKGITCFVVERGDVGFVIGRKLPKMGTRAYPAAELFFEDCFIPDDRRIGEEGQGFFGIMKWFQWTRTEQSATGLGIGRAALEYAIEYAKERHTWGKPIMEYQAVSFRLADAKIKLDQARLVCHNAAQMADAGKDKTIESSMAKLVGSEAAWDATYAAMQTLGSYGYSREYPCEKWLRDAKLEEIYEGTSDIHRLIIARSLFR
jgi:acyl-CoA dehydrogenase